MEYGIPLRADVGRHAIGDNCHPTDTSRITRRAPLGAIEMQTGHFGAKCRICYGPLVSRMRNTRSCGSAHRQGRLIKRLRYSRLTPRPGRYMKCLTIMRRRLFAAALFLLASVAFASDKPEPWIEI